MKALVKFARGNGNMELREVPEPSPAEGQVKVAVKATGICGSDLHIMTDEIAIPMNPPFVMGHEFCGVVAEVGRGVSGWNPGDRVTSETAYSVCGQCVYCRTGNYHLCRERKGIGFWYNGSFAPYIVVPAMRLHRLPANIDFIAGALCEPLAVVTHGILELSHIEAGDIVLVSGVGAIGLMAAQVARAQGGRVILSGLSADAGRFALAKKLGFEESIDVQREDLRALLAEKTKGQGPDGVLECSGSPEAARIGLEVIKKQGYYAQIGLFGKPFELNFETICYKELHVSGCFSQHWTSWEKALRLVETGAVKTAPLATDVYPLTRWPEAFAKFANKEGAKIVLEPGQ